MNASQEEVVRLERRFGQQWQIWTVPRAVGGVAWCARRWGDEKQVLNADSSDELEEMLEAAEGE